MPRGRALLKLRIKITVKDGDVEKILKPDNVRLPPSVKIRMRRVKEGLEIIVSGEKLDSVLSTAFSTISDLALIDDVVREVPA